MEEHHKTCWVFDGGLIPYAEAFDFQRRLVEARKTGGIPDILFLCEHPHVVTLGRNGKMEHLRASHRVLDQMNVEFQPTDRGGDITYHGPGQIVGYPILDLAAHRRDIRWYVNQLEEVMIRATQDFGVSAKRVEGCHGVWIDIPAGEEKIAALGVHLSRWVTSHGFAYNVSTDLRYFDLIVPCGIANKRATSLERVLQRTVTAVEARSRLVKHFGDVFNLRVVPVSRGEIDRSLASLSGERESLVGHQECIPGAEKAVAAAPELAKY